MSANVFYAGLRGKGAARMTEKEKMLAGLPFDPEDAELVKDRLAALDMCAQLDGIRPSALAPRMALLRKLLPNLREDVNIRSPFVCDFGYNVFFGKRPLVNYFLRIRDYARVTIGDDVFIGPRVTLDTLIDGMAPETAGGRPFALPITVGNDVWFGSEVTVLAGVTIGDRCVIGAGSVVTSDVPADCLAAGNPARVIRSLEPDAVLGR